MVSEWHVIFLSDITLRVYSKITRKMIYSTNVGGSSEMLGMCDDPLLQKLWMHSNKRLYYLEYSSEKTNIWIDYLKVRKYKEAERI